MNSNTRQKIDSALWGGVLCVALGLLVLYVEPLVLLSYDLLFLFRKKSAVEDVQIIYMDDDSFSKLGQKSSANWDRSLHADLLNRLDLRLVD